MNIIALSGCQCSVHFISLLSMIRVRVMALDVTISVVETLTAISPFKINILESTITNTDLTFIEKAA